MLSTFSPFRYQSNVKDPEPPVIEMVSVARSLETIMLDVSGVPEALASICPLTVMVTEFDCVCELSESVTFTYTFDEPSELGVKV